MPLAVASQKSDVMSALATASAEYGVPVEILRGVAYAESRFNPRPKDSPAGAKGLMQIMPANIKALGVTDPYDALQSARAGAQLLKKWYQRFGAWDLALAAYVWGPANVVKNRDPESHPEKVRKYVATVLAAAKRDDLAPSPAQYTGYKPLIVVGALAVGLSFILLWVAA